MRAKGLGVYLNEKRDGETRVFGWVSGDGAFSGEITLLGFRLTLADSRMKGFGKGKEGVLSGFLHTFLFRS
jgi:hypothetical protein